LINDRHANLQTQGGVNVTTPSQDNPASLVVFFAVVTATISGGAVFT